MKKGGLFLEKRFNIIIQISLFLESSPGLVESCGILLVLQNALLDVHQ